jgi:signal peptidase I
MRRSLRTIARVTTALVAGAVVAFAVGYATLLAAGLRPVVVYSGSMRPTLGVGSLAVDRVVPASSMRVGDVITFNDPYVKGRLVTHRVAKIVSTKHGLAFDVPVAGYVLWYAHTREIRALLLIVFGVFVLVAALRRIWRSEPARTVGA